MVDDRYPEWWNLDLTLAKIIAEKLRFYIEHSKSFPDNYTPELWKQKINSIATRLEHYTIRMEQPFELENEIVKQGQDALHELAEIFPALWD